ncbi:hypothetical protein CDD83_10938 [Cordyceps sp. RAO-2017]|nr:hypothetical protein CDD83_10938 [Cordyceps sp. RAO-2017]
MLGNTTTENRNVSCYTPACHEASAFLRGSLSRQHSSMSPCKEEPGHYWQYYCGGFNHTYWKKVPEHRPGVSFMSNFKDGVDEILRDMLTKPYVEVVRSMAGSDFRIDDSAGKDADNLKLASDYYRSCLEADDGEQAFIDLMNEVHRAFADMEAMEKTWETSNTYRPVMDTSKPFNDTGFGMLHDAQRNLLPYGIFLFAKLTVQPSLLNPNKTAMAMAPHLPYLAAAGQEAWPYKNGTLWPAYASILKTFLAHAHAPHLPRLQNIAKLPNQMIKLERELLEMGYDRRTLRLLKVSDDEKKRSLFVDEMTPRDLGNATRWPQLAMLPMAMPMPPNTTATVEVQHKDYFRVLHEVLKRHSMETIRSWALWQTFLQTRDLWDMPWTRSWTLFSHETFGLYANETREERCLARVQRHLGHILDSFYIRREHSKESHELAQGMATSVRLALLHMSITAHMGYWGDQSLRDTARWKLEEMKVAVGFPQTPNLLKSGSVAQHHSGVAIRAVANDTRPWEAGSSAGTTPTLQRPAKWTHLYDYFALERRSGLGSWSRPDNRFVRAAKDEWPIRAHSQEAHYSMPENKVFIPAGLLRMPLFHPSLPNWHQYGGVGKAMAEAMLQGIDVFGQQYHGNGSIRGRTWKREVWKNYEGKRQAALSSSWYLSPRGLRCFFCRDFKEQFMKRQTFVFEEAMNHLHAVDAAQHAWESQWAMGRAGSDTRLPGTGELSPHRLFWMSVTAPLCHTADGPEVSLRWWKVEEALVFSPQYACSHSCADPYWKPVFRVYGADWPFLVPDTVAQVG